ncbi:MAG: hypothetical protein FJW79_02785 [Actinobacteria bacterium]|nr:hypothetical protein [Actinomycetota bacterium]
MLALFAWIAAHRSDDRGVTTVEWLGMAAIAVIIVAFLLPQVRSGARDIWQSVTGHLSGIFP